MQAGEATASFVEEELRQVIHTSGCTLCSEQQISSTFPAGFFQRPVKPRSLGFEHEVHGLVPTAQAFTWTSLAAQPTAQSRSPLSAPGKNGLNSNSKRRLSA